MDSWEVSAKVIFEKLDRLHLDMRDIIDTFKRHTEDDKESFRDLNHNIGEAFKKIDSVESYVRIEIAKIKTMGRVFMFVWSTLLTGIAIGIQFI